MNTKHTPGPWTVSQYATTVNGPDGGPVASTMMLSDERISAKEQESNARLISAAPELLELAHLVMKWDSGELAGHIPIPAKVAAAARAANAKATERQ